MKTFHPSSILFALTGISLPPECYYDSYSGFNQVTSFVIDSLFLDKYLTPDSVSSLKEIFLFKLEFCRDFLSKICSAELLEYANWLQVNRETFCARYPTGEAMQEEIEKKFGKEITLEVSVASGEEVLEKLYRFKVATYEQLENISGKIIFKPLTVSLSVMPLLTQLPHFLREPHDLQPTKPIDSFPNIVKGLVLWIDKWLEGGLLNDARREIFKIMTGEVPVLPQKIDKYTWPEHTSIPTILRFFDFIEALQEVKRHPNRQSFVKEVYLGSDADSIGLSRLVSSGDIILKDFACWVGGYEIGGEEHPILKRLASVLLEASEEYAKTNACCLFPSLAATLEKPQVDKLISVFFPPMPSLESKRDFARTFNLSEEDIVQYRSKMIVFKPEVPWDKVLDILRQLEKANPNSDTMYSFNRSKHAIVIFADEVDPVRAAVLKILSERDGLSPK